MANSHIHLPNIILTKSNEKNPHQIERGHIQQHSITVSAGFDLKFHPVSSLKLLFDFFPLHKLTKKYFLRCEIRALPHKVLVFVYTSDFTTLQKLNFSISGEAS